VTPNSLIAYRYKTGVSNFLGYAKKLQAGTGLGGRKIRHHRTGLYVGVILVGRAAARSKKKIKNFGDATHWLFQTRTSS
jgi:hypothetical protein